MERGSYRYRGEDEANLNDACVANTVVSICSKIVGRELGVPEMYYRWRSMMNVDMARMYAGHQRRIHDKGLTPKAREHYLTALHKLDQKSFVKFANTARDGRGLPYEAAIMQTILQDVEIEYMRGGINDVKKEIDLGRQVAVSYQTSSQEGEKGWHISHIGRDPNGNLISYSDNNILVGDETVAEINSSATYLNGIAHTWNFVSVKKLGD